MKVPAIVLFAIYSGLVVTAAYFLCIFLVFPALCIYDGHLENGSKNCWWSFSFDGCRKRKPKRGQLSSTEEPRNEEEFSAHPHILNVQEETDECKKGRLHRILSVHYGALHKFRWCLLLLSIIAIGWCAYVALQFPYPDYLEPSFLPPSNRYEEHRVWSKRLLVSKLARADEGQVYFIFGS